MPQVRTKKNRITKIQDMEFKRPSTLMIDEESDILSNPLKRQKLMEIHSLLSQGNGGAIQPPISVAPANQPGGLANNGVIAAQPRRFENVSGQLHNIPKDSIPIIDDPYEVEDFFTDFSMNTNKKFRNKINNITRLFPPPLPPAIGPQESPEDEEYIKATKNRPQGDENDQSYTHSKDPHQPVTHENDNEDGNNGIMIPFIYPPPPQIARDPLIDDNVIFNRRGFSVSPHKPNIDNMVELAPLPFPPLNYMPYPLNANNSSLTPHDVFADFLEASTLLPRIDMVVASAAGSLFDLKLQAEHEGFTISKFNQEKEFERANNNLNSDSDDRNYDENSDNESRRPNTREEGNVLKYYESIDISNEFDKSNKLIAPSDDEQVSLGNYHEVKVKSALSNVKGKSLDEEDEQFDCDINYREQVLERLPEIADLIKDSEYLTQREPQRNRPGRRKASEDLESKRSSAFNALLEVEKFEQEHELDRYTAEKNQLLDEIEKLQKSQIRFTDEDDKLIFHEGLINFKKRQSEERDLELMKLKLQADYDKIRTLSTYYQDSNKFYGKYTNTLLTKLIKLKNFFEFQSTHFNNLLDNEGSNKSFQDLVDLTNKESSKIFNDFTDRNYNSDLKEILKLSILNSEQPKAGNKTKPQLLKAIDDLNINQFNLVEDLNKFSEVNDFAPLVSKSEFDLITGNILATKSTGKGSAAANKNANMNFKHEIFKHAIYDTSGSDSNSSAYNSRAGNGYSTPGATNNSNVGGNTQSNDAPKRRGGRRMNGLEIDEDSLNSETYLLAKILKHFIGPQGLTATELQEDFESLGVKSNWK